MLKQGIWQRLGRLWYNLFYLQMFWQTASMENEYWMPIARIYDPIQVGSIDGTDLEPHDRAIVRALRSNYRPNKGVVGDPACSIFVARLNHATTEDLLLAVFAKFGQIKHLRLVRDLVTGFSKGYAFVEYYDSLSTQKARRDANKMMLDDKEILVDFECERTLKGWIPRRLGGGFGGRKEAGQLRFGGRERPFRKPIIFPNHQRDPRAQSEYFPEHGGSSTTGEGSGVRRTSCSDQKSSTLDQAPRVEVDKEGSTGRKDYRQNRPRDERSSRRSGSKDRRRRSRSRTRRRSRSRERRRSRNRSRSRDGRRSRERGKDARSHQRSCNRSRSNDQRRSLDRTRRRDNRSKSRDSKSNKDLESAKNAIDKKVVLGQLFV